MPLLILARHAKAEAPRQGLDDHDRALTLEGRDAATRLGERLAELGIVPDVALVSSSNRTVQTFKRMATALTTTALQVDEDLYDCARARYISVVGRAGAADVVVVVGHEPTTSHVAAWLAGSGSLKGPLQRIAHGLPTSGAAILEVDVPWTELDARCARLIDVIEGKPL